MTVQPTTTRLAAALRALAVGPMVPVVIPRRPNRKGQRGFRKLDKHEVQRSAQRPVGERTPAPEVGDRLRYRHHMDEDPVPAVVLAVEDPGRRPRDDPNPLLRLATALTLGRGPLGVRSREARIAGTAGWLPGPP